MLASSDQRNYHIGGCLHKTLGNGNKTLCSLASPSGNQRNARERGYVYDMRRGRMREEDVPGP